MRKRGTYLRPIPARYQWSVWGQVQSAEDFGDGVVFVTTPGHGGFLVSPEASARMPENLRTIGEDLRGGSYAFEEDCAYAAVVLAFPEKFGADAAADAGVVVRRWFPDHLGSAAGCGIGAGIGSHHSCGKAGAR